MSYSIKEKIQGNLAVLYGGDSGEREVSLQSGARVMQALESMGIPATGIDCSISDLAGRILKYDIRTCFVILHGGDGENGIAQAILKSLNVDYTGSDTMASAIAMDKQRTKMIWQGAGLPTAPYVMWEHGLTYANCAAQIGNKMVIKPATGGSSIGVSIIDNEAAFNEGIMKAAEHGRNILVEQWIDGDEYAVSIVNDRVLPSVRMQAAGGFYDYEAKYLRDDTQYHCPAGLTEAEEKRLGEIAHQGFQVLGCSAWGRVDLMRDKAGRWFLIEVNTLPGMTSHSLVPMSAKAAGWGFEQLINEIMEASFHDR